MNMTFVQGQPQSPLAIQAALPHVVITGDLQLVVTESDVARGPIIGSYSIETRQMQEPLQVYWGAEGQVCNRQARVTDIAFEMPGFRAGQMWIYSVQAQVTDRWTSIVTGVFVQILVTADTLPQVSASA
ncbi:MAG TPA: hypothetical protein DEV72_23955 [Ktedonobacter sp.]|jgi:hypothetical protein|nr:hypothetical protein [Ktedonobacter sp.]